MLKTRSFRTSWMFMALGAMGVVGCDVTVVPPAEAVLQGAWLLSAPDSFENNGKIFVFDDLGRLTEIRRVLGNLTFIDRDPQQETRVTGSTVRIATNGDLIFEGTFNDAMNVINGHLRSEVTIPFTNDLVITDLGEATLTKQ